MKWLGPALFLLLAGCADYPRDSEGTLDRIRAGHVFKVGIVAGGAHAAAITRYLDRIAAATGARPTLTTGATEPLLIALEQGSLDLVVGEFAADSPWVTDVTLIEPLAERMIGTKTVALSPVARNGENRWIMLLERTARDSGTAQ